METLHRGQGQCGVGQDGSRRPPCTLNLASCPRTSRPRASPFTLLTLPTSFLSNLLQPGQGCSQELTPEHLQPWDSPRVGKALKLAPSTPTRLWSEGSVGFESVSDSGLARKAESSPYPHSLPRWEIAHPPLILKPKSLSWLVFPKKDQNECLSFSPPPPISWALPVLHPGWTLCEAVYLQTLVSFSPKMW